MDSMQHLIAIAQGRNARQESEDAAVRRLLETNPRHERQPTQAEDAVHFLVGLTRKELDKQEGR